MTEQRYYAQFNESINSIIELTTRVDERVQLIMKQQKDLENKIDAQLGLINSLNTKVAILESQDTSGDEDAIHKLELRLQTLENSSNNQENRWKTIFGFVVQLIWVILAAFLLYKLGIQAPAVP